MDNDEMEPIKKKSIAEKTRPVWKFLPYGSLINFLDKSLAEKDSKTKLILKLLGHIAYAGVSTLIASDYFLGVSDTESWSYPEQKKIYAERIIKQEEAKARYAELEQSIFGKNGYADVNQDGNVDAQERLNAYEKMGLDSVVVLPSRKPTTLELKNAVYFLQ